MQRRRTLRIMTRPTKAKKQKVSESESESSNKTLLELGGRNWIDLPDEVTASILSRLSMLDILERAQKVCLTWRRICKDPMFWHTIHMEFDIHLCQQNGGNFTIRKIAERKDLLRQFLNFDANVMCHHAIDRSCGNLVDISIRNCGTNKLLEYMTDRSRRIRRLSIVFSASITIEGLSKVASNLPLLEDLEISYTPLSCKPYGLSWDKRRQSHKYLKVIGRCCPLLRSLKLNKHRGCMTLSDEHEDNGDAFAIAGTMHGLLNLQLFGNRLDHKGMYAILEGCPRLESLDVRQCNNLYLKSCGWGLPPILKGSSHLEKLKARCFEAKKRRSRFEGMLWDSSESDEDYEHLAIDKIVDRRYRQYLISYK